MTFRKLWGHLPQCSHLFCCHLFCFTSFLWRPTGRPNELRKEDNVLFLPTLVSSPLSDLKDISQVTNTWAGVGATPSILRACLPFGICASHHGTDTFLHDTLGEPCIVERNQNSEQHMIAHLSFFFNIHNSMRVVHSRFSDYTPRESWKLGTQILATRILVESLDIYGPSSY